MCQMLEINPYFRPSCKQLLENPIFNEIRVPNLQEPAEYKIKLGIDTTEAYARNYEDLKDKPELKTTLLKVLAKELKNYYSNPGTSASK